MYTKSHLMTALAALNINPRGTLLVHSSMKAIGPVEGGAEGAPPRRSPIPRWKSSASSWKEMSPAR